MKISYNKLFKLLIDRKMKKKELSEKAGISASTIVKMGRNEPVSVELIGKICLALDCTADDILEFSQDVSHSGANKEHKERQQKNEAGV